MFIDTHCHLTYVEKEELGPLLDRAISAGVTGFICIGEKDALDLSLQRENIWAAVSVHPNEVTSSSSIKELEAFASNPKVVSIGETGLDTYRGDETISEQRRYFRETIALAKNLNKPLVIHSRSTRDECYQMLLENEASEVGGVFHCYGEDAEFAKKLYDINFKISLTGILTFKAAKELRAEVAKIPLEQIMLETDMPYLAPEPVRGRPCEPSYLPHTAKVLAELKGLEVQEIGRITTDTARRFFKL